MLEAVEAVAAVAVAFWLVSFRHLASFSQLGAINGRPAWLFGWLHRRIVTTVIEFGAIESVPDRP